LIANYLEHKSENISIAVTQNTFTESTVNHNFYLHEREILFLWVGELADGFGCQLASEETPPTMLNCSACKGVG